MAKKNFKFNYFLLLCVLPIVVAIAIAFPQSVTTHEYNSSGGVKATSPLEFHFNPNYSGSSFTQEEWNCDLVYAGCEDDLDDNSRQ